MAKIRQTVDTSESDRVYVCELEKQIDMLTGMVEECFVENKQWLLSPIMRELVIEKGRKVAKMMMKAKGRLVIDNPCDDLKVQE